MVGNALLLRKRSGRRPIEVSPVVGEAVWQSSRNHYARCTAQRLHHPFTHKETPMRTKKTKTEMKATEIQTIETIALDNVMGGCAACTAGQVAPCCKNGQCTQQT